MKKVILPTAMQSFMSEVNKSIAERLGTRIARLTVASVFETFMTPTKRSLKALNLIFDFTEAQVIKVSHVAEDVYNLFLADGSERFAFANESISRYKPAVKVSKKTNPSSSESFAVALIRPSRKGNTRFLHKNGKFNASYANRYVYSTMKGAENLIQKIYDNNEVKPYTLKVVSA